MAEIPRNMTLEEAYNLRRDRAIEALQHQIERMVNLLEDGVPRRNRTRSENGDTTIVSSSTESEDGSSNPEDYYEWVQTMDRIMEMNTLKQGSMNVADYIRELEQLKIRTNVKEDEEHTIARFIGGLNASITDQLAIQVEKQAKKKSYFKSYSKPAMLPMKGQSSMLPKHNEAASKVIKGKEQVLAGPKNDRRKCFKCHGFRHFQAQCPNQRALTLKEIEDLEGGFKTEPSYDESDNEEFIAADIGEFLMIRRVMHSAETIEDKSQRENIFHSRCTVKGKVCSLIVDGGSCANATSAHMDEITCDVIPMDACHFLLARPWLFDKYVYHNGHQNTYSLYVNGKKITLTSLMPSEIPDPTVKNDKSLFMTQAEVDTELKGGTGAYLLLLVESDELNWHDEVPARAGTSNTVADALSRRYSLLSILEARVLGFSFVKELYEADPDFAPILNCSPAEIKRDYVEHDGFLFKDSRLCIPKDSIREMLIREAHGGGLAGHFGINKTLEILNEHFCWPCMDKDVKAVINRCATCFQAKSAFHKGLYTPLPVPNQP
ncbi:uncharacterized protein [Rutidosis leptorrhynchoides]|uniref:uncharacterized protein n=1 Tax=Rutidosis leptorrhynchoides TaxID=125765 RepID=UPI003A99024D